MNDLQLALLGLGGAAVLGVWAYNKWQERGHRRLAENMLAGGQPDVLLGGASAERQEPALAPAEPSPATDEPLIAAGEPPGAVPPAPTLPPWADEVADGIARIAFAQPVPAPALWAAQAEWAGRLSKPLQWLAQDEAGAWRRVDAHDAGRCAAVLAALQLADRRGAASESELAAFADGVRDVAGRLAGAAEVPEVGRMHAHARSLDEFCASVDVQLAIGVVANEGMFAGTKLRGLAEAAGLALDDDGGFHARDERGETLYTLGNLGAELFDADTLKSLATHGVALTLDVPRVADGARTFDRMVAAGRQLAQALGGTLVDTQRAPLSDAMIAGIRAKLVELQTRMAENQVVAGSPRALRLFS